MQTMEKPIDGKNAPRLQTVTSRPSHLFSGGGEHLFLITETALVIGLVGSVLAMQSGMITLHMAGHIIAMNVAAPAGAWLLFSLWSRAGASHLLPRLLLATALQLLVFFLWHSPPAMALSMHSAAIRLGMLFILSAASVWFWSVVFEAIAANRFEAIGALLVTGKLVCLVAVLMVFAPRILYPGMSQSPMEVALIGDQQLAGLLMLSACPLTYIGASVFVVAKWLSQLSAPADGDRPG